MAYGFSALNDSNIVQIDQDYSNYVYYSSGTVPAGPWNVYGQDLFTWITLPCLNALVFVQVSQDTGFYCVLDYTNLLKQGIHTGGVCTYYIYVPSYFYTPSTASYGLNIYRGDGSLSFSSNYNYLKITRITSFNVNAYSPIAFDNTLPALTPGKVRAVSLHSLTAFGFDDWIDYDTNNSGRQIYNAWFFTDQPYSETFYFDVAYTPPSISNGNATVYFDNTVRTLMWIEV